MHKVFIDGQEGTTGLEIHERLRRRTDLELLEIAPLERKDPAARKRLINAADVVITCLPDAAAIEAVQLIDNERTKVIDPSTAHRTAANWAYGLPELSPAHREAIRSGGRVSVPGCYATGMVAALYPLVQAKVVPADYPVVVHAVSGYSGGGKKLIGAYESAASEEERQRLRGARLYAFGLQHKHIPEMQKVVGLAHAPLFQPMVADYYKGMLVSVPLVPRLQSRRVTPADVQQVLAQHYGQTPFVRVMPLGAERDFGTGYLDPLGCNDTNRLDLFVFGRDEQIAVVARLDNLGKGASGAAVQCLNLSLGVEETTGLTA